MNAYPGPGPIARLQENHATYLMLLAEAKRLYARGSLPAAATVAEIAALLASSCHSGVFASTEIDALLLGIGRTLPVAERRSHPRMDTPQRVLHVATWVGPIGGLSRFLWRWIGSDQDRCHSLVVTHQTKGELPVALLSAVRKSGGTLHLLNRMTGGVLAWALRLRRLMAEADLVVLHVGTHDVVPILALANKTDLPPVVLVNHADHLFWIGGSVVDIVVNSRHAAEQLCIARRGIPEERNFLLPLLAERPAGMPDRSRRDAKAALGIDPDKVVLLSIARGIKYRVHDEPNYAEAVLPILKRHRNAVLVVVGPAHEEDWSKEVAEAEGRIRAWGEESETDIFYRAADIYLDSYPFSSITSLIEAGSHGLPLVSRFPFSRDCAILGGEVPGIAETVRIAETLEVYRDILDELIEDAGLRSALGERTQANVERLHMGEGWRGQLLDLYGRTASIHPKIHELPPSVDEFHADNLDRRILRIADWDVATEKLILSRLKILPVRDLSVQAVALVRKFGLVRLLRAGLLASLTPEWIVVRVRRIGRAAPNGQASAASAARDSVSPQKTRADKERPRGI